MDHFYYLGTNKSLYKIHLISFTILLKALEKKKCCIGLFLREHLILNTRVLLAAALTSNKE